MPRGGRRPGAGRPKGSKNKKTKTKGIPQEVRNETTDYNEQTGENLTPLEYMLKIMNDDGADADRRDRMAPRPVRRRPGR